MPSQVADHETNENPMSLKIRTILPLIISALALLLVVSAGLTAYDAIGRR